MANTDRLINNKGYDVDKFVVSDSVVDYDVRANEDNFTEGVSFRVELSTDETVSVKAVYIDVETGLEVTQPAIVIPELRSPHTFPSGPIVNLLISNSSGQAANIQVINSIPKQT